MTYAQLLKDPRWQKRRLEILNIHNFTCQFCGAKEITLHVHHWTYEKGRAPWDYPDHNFACLCENCHSIKHIKLDTIVERILNHFIINKDANSVLAINNIILEQYGLKEVVIENPF